MDGMDRMDVMDLEPRSAALWRKAGSSPLQLFSFLLSRSRRSLERVMDLEPRSAAPAAEGRFVSSSPPLLLSSSRLMLPDPGARTLMTKPTSLHRTIHVDRPMNHRRDERRMTLARAIGAVAIGSLLALPLAACERASVTSRPPAERLEQTPEDATTAPPAAASSSPTTSARNPERPWSVPEGWTEDAAPRPMRLTTYLAPDPSGEVEVAVTRFGGRVGGALANINRWRGQMGLSPVDESELEATIVRFTSPGFDGYRVRIDGESGVMLAAAVYEASIDQTWFVRTVVGDTEIADRLEVPLFGMANSIAGIQVQLGE
jgi:hypothetical protein